MTNIHIFYLATVKLGGGLQPGLDLSVGSDVIRRGGGRQLLEWFHFLDYSSISHWQQSLSTV